MRPRYNTSYFKHCSGFMYMRLQTIVYILTRKWNCGSQDKIPRLHLEEGYQTSHPQA